MSAAPNELPIEPLEVLHRRRSAKWQTHPPDVLPMFVAEMDVSLAPEITAVLHEAVGASDVGYSMTSPELGEALAGFARRWWAWEIDPSSVLAVPDVAVGIVELLRVVAGPGQRVVVSSPVYPPFFGWGPEAGASVVDVPLAFDTSGWHLDLDHLDDVFATHPAAYVLCNPHNPVGRTHSPEELAALVGLAHRHGVTIISDEIHAPLVLPDSRLTPLLTVPGGAEVGVSLQSASKAFNLAGLKCAAVVPASSAMRAVVARLPDELGWRVGHLGSLATVAAWRSGDAWLDRLLVTLDRRRTQLDRLIAAHLPGVTWTPPTATYLAWLDCRAIGPGRTASDLWLQRGRVALEPGPRFGPAGDGHARLNFATSADILEEAVRRMAAALPEAQ